MKSAATLSNFHFIHSGSRFAFLRYLWLSLLVLLLFSCHAYAQIQQSNYTAIATPVNTPIQYIYSGSGTVQSWTTTDFYATIATVAGSRSAQITWPVVGAATLTCHTTNGNYTFSLTVVGCQPLEGAVWTRPIDFGVFSEYCVETKSSTGLRLDTDCYLDNYNTALHPSTTAQPSPDVYYRFRLTRQSEVVIQTCGSSFDTYIHLLPELRLNQDIEGISNNDAGNQGACSNTTQSYLRQTLAPGMYYVIAEGSGMRTGSLNMSISATPQTGATPLSVWGGTIVMGETGTLTASPGFDTYVWSTDATSRQITVTPLQTTTYTVTATSCNGAYSATAQGTITVVSPNQNTFNYVAARRPRVAGKTTETAVIGQASGQVQLSTTYLDELGNTIQTVTRQESPGGLDIVQPTLYDAFGREPREYLPYTDGTDGNYKGDAVSEIDQQTGKQQSFYARTNDRIANDPTPSSLATFELSPLNRVTQQSAPGEAWRTHPKRSNMRTNRAHEVRQWEISIGGKGVSSPGYYDAGELFVEERTDEDNNLLIEYKDRQGHVILKKVQESATVNSTSVDTDFLITSYVYDQSEQLRLVIQPEGMRHLPQPAGNGKLSKELWIDVLGQNVQAFPLSIPTSVSTLSSFEAPANQGENYAQRLRGYVIPPTTGTYTFWIASDDNSELWLSTSEAPGKKRLIAYVNDWTGDKEWEKYPATQKSVLISLEAGKRYFVEAMHKEGGGGDNLAVGWQLPDGSLQERPIPENRLVTDAISLSAAFIDSWCFRYEYDGRKRQIEKQVPGAGPTYVIYNRRDQAVLTIDANRNRIFTKYDALGRAILTGKYWEESSLTPSQLQASADAVDKQWEELIAGTPTGTYDYSLTHSYPTQVDSNDLLTRTFYDSYTYSELGSLAFEPVSIAASAISSSASQAGFSVSDADQSKQVQGLITAVQELVLDENVWITTLFYYDDKGRVIQKLSTHWPNASGEERLTLKLDFMGNVMQSYLTHTYPSSTLNSAPVPHALYQENEYDHAHRLLKTWMKVDDQDKIVLSQFDYNELGQVVDKRLHGTNVGFLQSIDYRYNIRGWLSNINDRNLNNNGEAFNDADANDDNLAVDQPDLYGVEIMYHKNQNLGLSEPRFNGNISEVMWQTRNTGAPNDDVHNKLRGYAYSYDKANRLTAALYRTYEGSGWGIYGTNYSVTGVTYDGNGNITHMTRQGDSATPKQPALLDQLQYTYADANRLIAVDDGADRTSPTAPTHDFEDNGKFYGGPGGSGIAEYDYNANGSVITDHNKGIDYISYNYLNKPIWISLSTPTNYYYIHYDYSASGVKLRKTTYEYNNTFTTEVKRITDYVGSFVFQDQVLQFAATAEGRLLYTLAPTPGMHHWKYEYHIKDHLGNLRVAFRDEGGNAQQRAASMEPVNAWQEEKEFKHISETRLQDVHRARTGSYVARLNAREGKRLGPSVTWAVQAGDSLNAEVYGRYDHVAAIRPLLQRGAIITGTAVVGSPGSTGPEQASKQTTRHRFIPYLASSIAFVPQLLKPRKDEVPTAFLRYDLFSKDSQLVATHTEVLQRTATDEWQHLRTGFKADSAGYARVSVINESDVPAYFDDLALRLVDAPKTQENHYDPWGLNLLGIETVGTPNSDFQYNGKEKQSDFSLNWTDYGARMYDAQLARWHTVDPLADLSRRWSPYAYTYNNPLSFTDPDGMLPLSTSSYLDGQKGQDNDGFFNIFENEGFSGLILPSSERQYLAGPEKPGKGKKDKGSKDPKKEDAPKPEDTPRLTLEDLKKGPPQVPGYVPPKSGHRKEKNPNGSGSGWIDRNGEIWVPTDHKGTHAPHWEKQRPGGEYDNIYPTTTPATEVTGAVMTYIMIYEIVKWGAAILIAPETLGGSLGAAAAMP